LWQYTAAGTPTGVHQDTSYTYDMLGWMVSMAVLQLMRPAMPGRLGDRPAVVIYQFHQQPAHHLAARLPGHPGAKSTGHPSQQVCQQRGVNIIGTTVAAAIAAP
jgi:hypothetical protein